MLFSVCCVPSDRPALTTLCCVLRQYFAHRTSPGVLVQEVKVRNPTDRDHMLELTQQGVMSHWEGAAVRQDRYGAATGQDQFQSFE